MNTSRQMIGLDQNLINENRRKLKNCLVWGSTNTLLLAICLYDIIHTCPFNVISFILYLEYTLSAIFLFNIIYYFIRYINISLNTISYTVYSNNADILNNKNTDPNYSIISNDFKFPAFVQSNFDNTPNTSFTKTPMNLSAQSWRSNVLSFNGSPSFINSSPSFSCVRSSPQYSPYEHHSTPNNSSLTMAPRDNCGGDLINDENSLTEYLKGYQVYEKTAKVNNPIEQPTSLLSSFWSHPAAKSSGDVQSLLRKCQYQLSPLTPGSSSSSPSGKSDDKSSPANIQPQGMEMWRRLQVDSYTLTQWTANIRTWISQTIVERLVKEINTIDDALQKHGFLDVKVGNVGLDRLRKTAQMAPVLQFIPTLSTLIPFLELSANQEYLVKRIRELAKGGCMSDYKWNGGSSFNGKPWNDSLPSDSVIIMHLFTTYMDTQLLPLPSKPDVKPFTGNHYIKLNEKLPELAFRKLAIHHLNEKPPHFHVVVGEEIFEIAKGYNNLFHSLLLFIHQVNKKEHGMLGRINLGRAGVNILWVIDS